MVAVPGADVTLKTVISNAMKAATCCRMCICRVHVSSGVSKLQG